MAVDEVKAAGEVQEQAESFAAESADTTIASASLDSSTQSMETDESDGPNAVDSLQDSMPAKDETPPVVDQAGDAVDGNAPVAANSML